MYPSDLEKIIEYENGKKVVYATKLNPHTMSLIQPHINDTPEYFKHLYDDLFGAGVERIYLDDQPVTIEINVNNPSVKQAVKQINNLVDVVNEVSKMPTEEYEFVEKFEGMRFKHIEEKDFITDSMKYKELNTFTGKRDIKVMSIKNFFDTVKEIYNYFYNLARDEFRSDAQMSEKDKKFWEGKFAEINRSGADEDLKEAIKNYNKINAVGLKADKLIVCITRNPIDVAASSTGRKWHSCMRLPLNPNDPGQCYHKHVYEDIKYGTIAAYLINEDDRDIDDARARMLIKPYFSDTKTYEYAALRVPPIIYHDGTLNGQGKKLDDMKDVDLNDPKAVDQNLEYGNHHNFNYDSFPILSLFKFKNIVDKWVKESNEILFEKAPELTVFKKIGNLYYENGEDDNIRSNKGKDRIKDTNEVKENLSKYYAGEIEEMPYNIGDIITLNDNSRYGIIIGKNHDTFTAIHPVTKEIKRFVDFETEKKHAALTVMCLNSVDTEINIRNSKNRVKSDKTCGWFNSDLSMKFSDRVKRIVGIYADRTIPIVKLTSGGRDGDPTKRMTTILNIFILSISEIFGLVNEVSLPEGGQYEYFKTDGTRLLRNSWTRSLYVPRGSNKDEISNSVFNYIDSSGNIAQADETNKDPHLVLPCFCL